MNKVKVSVIVPVYNHSEYVQEALQSVLEQTYSDYEIIIINDGSSDSSARVIDRFSDGKGNVKVIHQGNRGLSAARNAAINSSMGEYIALLDADDLWKPDKLSKQIEVMEKNPDASMCHTDGIFLHCDGTLSAPAKRIDNKKLHYLEHIIPYNKVFAPSVIIRRSMGDKEGWFNEELRRSEDWELWLRLVKLGSIIYIPDPLIIYRLSPGSLSRSEEAMSHSIIHLIENYMAPQLDELLKLVSDQKRASLLRSFTERRAAAYSALGKWALVGGNLAKSRQAHYKALKICPYVVRYYLRLLRTFLPQRWQTKLTRVN